MSGIRDNPIAAVLETQSLIVLDGGLATELERRGHDLDDPLWSARVLLDAPDAIAGVHRDYLNAGADCITTATYQATFPGLRRRGFSGEEAAGVLLRAVTIAVEVRDRFWDDAAHRVARVRPLVAASIGPYGAFLADGSEYAGDYDIDDAGLSDFHRDRLAVLADSDADLLACETVPSGREARVLLGLLSEHPVRWAWLSFSCRDGKRLWDGTRVAEIAAACDRVPNVAAIGVNCTAPGHVGSLIAEISRETRKPLIVYPNSGETYDAAGRRWTGDRPGTTVAQLAPAWVSAGAAGIGGCCRVGPDDIHAVRAAVLPPA